MHKVAFGFRPGTDCPHVEFHLFSQERFGETCLQAHVVITFDQCHAKRSRDELLYGAAKAAVAIVVAGVASSCGASSSASSSPAAPTSTSSMMACVISVSCSSCSELRLNVFAFLDLGDVLGHGCIGANPVGIHKADQFGLGQVTWGAGFAIDDVGFSWFERFM